MADEEPSTPEADSEEDTELLLTPIQLAELLPGPNFASQRANILRLQQAADSGPVVARAHAQKAFDEALSLALKQQTHSIARKQQSSPRWGLPLRTGQRTWASGTPRAPGVPAILLFARHVSKPHIILLCAWERRISWF